MHLSGMLGLIVSGLAMDIEDENRNADGDVDVASQTDDIEVEESFVQEPQQKKPRRLQLYRKRGHEHASEEWKSFHRVRGREDMRQRGKFVSRTAGTNIG